MCGSMFCGGGGESITGKRAAYTVHSTQCKLAVDDDKTRSMDMVPSGTRCGPEKVCVRVCACVCVCVCVSAHLSCVQVCLGHRCVDTSVYGNKEDCAKKCNNNGVRGGRPAGGQTRS